MEHTESAGTLSALETWLHEHKLAAALAGGMALASCDHAPAAEAAEITPGASWEEGVETLQQSVFTEEKEQAAFFVGGGDRAQNQTWAPLRLTQKDSYNAFMYSVEPADTVLLHMRWRDPDVFIGRPRACYFHTHPLRLAQQWFYSDADKKKVEETQHLGSATLVAPPSFLDFYGHTQMLMDLKNQHDTYASPALIGAVASPAGIWYYERATEEEQKEAEGFFARWPSMLPPPQREEKPTPMEVYTHWQSRMNEYSLARPVEEHEMRILNLAAQYAGYTMRFVPYEAIMDEPPCAGVFYQGAVKTPERVIPER